MSTKALKCPIFVLEIPIIPKIEKREDSKS